MERSNRSWPKCAPKSRCKPAVPGRENSVAPENIRKCWEDQQLCFLQRNHGIAFKVSVKNVHNSKIKTYQDFEMRLRCRSAAAPSSLVLCQCQAHRNLPQKRMLGEEQPLILKDTPRLGALYDIITRYHHDISCIHMFATARPLMHLDSGICC